MVKRYKIVTWEGVGNSYKDFRDREYETEEKAISIIKELLSEDLMPTETFSIMPVYRND
jgi:hypothetical protein